MWPLQKPTSWAEFIDADPVENPSFSIALLDAIDGIPPVIPERTLAEGDLSSRMLLLRPGPRSLEHHRFVEEKRETGKDGGRAEQRNHGSRWRDATAFDRGNLVGARWKTDAAEDRCEACDRHEIAEVVGWDAKEKIRRYSHPAVAVFEDRFEIEHHLDHRDRGDG